MDCHKTYPDPIKTFGPTIFTNLTCVLQVHEAGNASYPFYIVSYYIKCVTFSWTHCIFEQISTKLYRQKIHVYLSRLLRQPVIVCLGDIPLPHQPPGRGPVQTIDSLHHTHYHGIKAHG